MPGPPPPPPAGGLPPPPAFAPPAPSSKGGGDQRGALLSAIRKGKPLKKAVTVDKSGPYIPGKVTNASHDNSPASGGGGGDRQPPSGGLPNGLVGLGSLFPGGQIPKLRPVGISNPSNGGNGTGSNGFNTSSVRRSPDSTTAPPKTFSSTQNEIKRRMANDNRNRGPPPPAPSRTPITPERNGNNTSTNNSSSHVAHHPKPGSVSDLRSMTLMEPNRTALHKRAVSNSNLPEPPSEAPRNHRPSFGKPNVAPKPPTLINGIQRVVVSKPLNRTQSMKNPRSPSPQSPGSPAAEKNVSNFGTVRNLKPELKEALASMHQVATVGKPTVKVNDRPKAPPPSVPTAPKAGGVKHPGHAPPPPPMAGGAAPPPVPPHRTAPHVPPRTVPPPPPNVSSNGNVAPPPPPRIYSMRDTTLGRPATSPPSDLEARFEDRFRDVTLFPAPLRFRGVEKVYGGKQVGGVKQPAPLPPNHVLLNNNRLWESSTC